MLTVGDKKWIEDVVTNVVEGSEKRIRKDLGDRIDEVEVNLHKRIDEVENHLEAKIESVGGDVEEVRGNLARVERKLDNVTDHQAEKLDDHETRIGKLEVATI